jgi:hypothetical protein
MGISYWRPLLVDRISITVQIGSVDLYNMIRGQLDYLRDNQKELLPGGQMKLKKEKYLTRLDYYPSTKQPTKRKIADITICVRPTFDGKGIHRFFVLALYPSKFEPGEFEHFKTIIKLLHECEYESLYHTGKVTYLELAADSFSYEKHGLLPFRKYCKKSSIYENNDGTLGTVYTGHESSDLQFLIYDKRRQLQETKQPVKYSTFPVHTRIEASMRRLKCTPSGLINMPNPFLKLQIADLGKAIALSDDPVWQQFLAIARQEGIPKSMSLHPKHRKKFLAMLTGIEVTWWNPTFIWEGLPQALAVLEP